jgi:hypothetical protein
MAQAQVSVKVHGTEFDRDAPTDDYIGSAHARLGQPVSITITRGNNSSTQHFTWGEATALYDALDAARKGRA